MEVWSKKRTWKRGWRLADEVKLPVKIYSIPCPFVSPRARESKTVLDSGFHAVDSGFQEHVTWAYKILLSFLRDPVMIT